MTLPLCYCAAHDDRALSNRDIAAQLFLSPRTVGHHLYRAYPKLGITRRTELGRFAFSGS